MEVYKIMTIEATNRLFQRIVKGATKNCFIVDGCFSLERPAESAMYVGAEMVDMVETNAKGFCKDFIKNIAKDCPRVSYLI